MGDSACPVIEQALRSLGIETRTGISIVAIDSTGVTLDSGEMIPAATVVWCAGMSANPLTRYSRSTEIASVGSPSMNS